jgi:hypothetical protein
MQSRDVTTTDLGKGVFRVSGQELLASVGQPGDIGGSATSLPAGGILLAIPVNPRFIDGCRVAKILEMYDQFRIRNIVFEYHPVTSAFTPGQLCMGYVNDINDAISSDTGFQAVRDLYTRSGAILFNVAAGAKCSLGHPLLKWYYTANQILPELEMPGILIVQTTQPLTAGAGTAGISYGLVTMSYDIEVRSPSIENPSPALFSFSSLSAPMTNLTGAVGAAVSLPAASFPAGVSATVADVVYWGTIVAVDDVAFGSAGWRTWRDSNGATRALGPGNVLFMRVCRDGAANIRMLFAPTLSDAMTINSVAAGDAYTATVAQNLTIRGFKLWNVQGFALIAE